jgi:hypothetical protein
MATPLNVPQDHADVPVLSSVPYQADITEKKGGSDSSLNEKIDKLAAYDMEGSNRKPIHDEDDEGILDAKGRFLEPRIGHNHSMSLPFIQEMTTILHTVQFPRSLGKYVTLMMTLQCLYLHGGRYCLG